MNFSSSISTTLSSATRRLEHAAISSAQLDAEILLCFILKKERSFLRSHGEKKLTISEQKKFSLLIERREKRVPIAYLTHQKEFYGRTFFVDEHTLIPRPETETLIEELAHIVQKIEGAVLADIGCGSGAIGITCAQEFSCLKKVILSDISPEALEVAQKNASIYPSKKNEFRLSDLLEDFSSEDLVDVLVANLPYVDRAWQRSPETEYEPAVALFAENNGRSLIEKLISQAAHILKKNAFLVIECDPCQFSLLKKYGTLHDFSCIKTIDYCMIFSKK